jgi:hypothetical protein
MKNTGSAVSLRVDSREITDDEGGLTFVRRHSHHGGLKEEARTR